MKYPHTSSNTSQTIASLVLLLPCKLCALTMQQSSHQDFSLIFAESGVFGKSPPQTTTLSSMVLQKREIP